jgi:hypothetical protein
MRKMPERFSRKWWCLWFSGAIPRDVVFFDHLADELRRYQNESEPHEYFDPADPLSESVDEVRSGSRMTNFSRGFVDLSARVAGDLRLRREVYQELTKRLFGKTAEEVSDSWRAFGGENGANK